MNTSPLVSVVIPTFDRPHFLREALDSVIGQDYPTVEIIVVDDGSPTDSAREVCESYTGVRYFRTENTGGPAHPRNLGIRAANGEYVAFLDDDDRWLPHKLREQVKRLEENPDLVLVSGCCEVVDGSGQPLNRIVGRPGSPEVKRGNLVPAMVGNFTLMTSTVLARRSAIESTGYFNESMPAAGEDYEYWCRLALQGPCDYLEQPVSQYREEDGISQTGKRNYVHTPLYLFKAMDLANREGYLSDSDLEQVRENLVRMQLQRFRLGPGTAVTNLFKIDTLWWIKPGNWKLLMAVCLKPTN
jgi:glycosyltransferase involved in cell wall biosynthesis